VIPDDPCVQWIWLKLKDRPPFAARDHPHVFTTINATWPSGDEDQLVSQAYADAIVGHFRREPEPDAAGRLLRAIELSEQRLSPEAILRDRCPAPRARSGARPGSHGVAAPAALASPRAAPLLTSGAARADRAPGRL
jgi:hypothetical protein